MFSCVQLYWRKEGKDLRTVRKGCRSFILGEKNQEIILTVSKYKKTYQENIIVHFNNKEAVDSNCSKVSLE